MRTMLIGACTHPSKTIQNIFVLLLLSYHFDPPTFHMPYARSRTLDVLISNFPLVFHRSWFCLWFSETKWTVDGRPRCLNDFGYRAHFCGGLKSWNCSHLVGLEWTSTCTRFYIQRTSERTRMWKYCITQVRLYSARITCGLVEMPRQRICSRILYVNN